jgi:ketoreductase RED2
MGGTAPVVLVTGSTSGIGRACAERFAAQGARVVVNSVRSVAEGEALAASLPDAAYVQGDVADENDAKRLLAFALERYGRLDTLVNNAGTTEVIPHDDLDAATDEVWQRILDTNLMGAWYMSRISVPALRETHGSIVNVSSVAGIVAGGSSLPYAVSKAALNHLTRLLAAALGPDVRVNAVAPGLIETPWVQGGGWDAVRTMVEQRAPLARAGTPEDVAELVTSLAYARYVTGQVVVVDGGLTLR